MAAGSESIYPGCIGIDLGTTNSCVAVWKDDHVEIIPNHETGRNTTPSWVAFTREGILVGELARKQATRNSANTIFDIKRLMGRKYTDEDVMEELDRIPYRLTQDSNGSVQVKVEYQGAEIEYRPEQISAMILGKMREIAEEYLGQRVNKAVITVPAYFNDTQRTATQHAATIAGMECLRIINEPTSASLCYGLNQKGESMILVFDLGGGTFDVSLLEIDNGVIEVKGTAGDTHLGGEDFDAILTNYVLEQFERKLTRELGDAEEAALIIVSLRKSGRKMQRLKSEIETAKRSLSTAPSAEITIDSFHEDFDLDVEMSRIMFERLCKDHFSRCLDTVKQVLEDANVEKSEVTDIVLVGGSTRIPKVQQMLSEYFEGRTLNKSINPDEAVAYGAAIQGAILTKSDTSAKTKDISLLDVIPLSLGVETAGGTFDILIKRNESIPAKKERVYITTEDRQTSIEVKVYEGERDFTEHNHQLAAFDLTGIPPAPRGVAKIKITFIIDENGVLTVIAEDKDTGNVAQAEIGKDNSRLTPEEVERMLQEADLYRSEDKLRKQSMIARNHMEKFMNDVLELINHPDLKLDEEGKPLLTEDQMAYVNQYIINSTEWLVVNKDAPRETIEMAHQTVEKKLNKVLNRVYTRKKQLRLKEASDRAQRRKAAKHNLTKEEKLAEIFNETVGESGGVGDEVDYNFAQAYHKDLLAVMHHGGGGGGEEPDDDEPDELLGGMSDEMGGSSLTAPETTTSSDHLERVGTEVDSIAREAPVVIPPPVAVARAPVVVPPPVVRPPVIQPPMIQPPVVRPPVVVPPPIVSPPVVRPPVIVPPPVVRPPVIVPPPVVRPPM